MREKPFGRGKGASGNCQNTHGRTRLLFFFYVGCCCGWNPACGVVYLISKTKRVGGMQIIVERNPCPPPRDRMDSTYSIMHFSIHCKEHAFTFRIVYASWSHPGLFFWIKAGTQISDFLSFTHTEYTGPPRGLWMGCRWKAIVWSWFINRLHAGKGVVVDLKCVYIVWPPVGDHYKVAEPGVCRKYCIFASFSRHCTTCSC